MKKIITTAAIVIVTVVIASHAQAGPKSGNSNNTSKNVSPAKNNVNKVAPVKLNTSNKPNTTTKISNYHLTFGTKSSFGYSYKGKHHNHWTLIRFDVRYGCNCYWDPCLFIWYYWCERDFCFYPVSYCPYRCYSCTEVTVVTPIRPQCDTCTTVSPAGIATETIAPP